MEVWRSLTSVLTGLGHAVEQRLRWTADLSYFEYRILESLSWSPGSSMRMTDLGAACDASLSTLSRAVSRLETRALVRRQTDSSDGRYTLCLLTEEGETAVREAAPGHVQQVRRLVFDALSETEVRDLGAICRRLEEALAKERRS
jgi:DNA-binding MarR family transcriptional regulator